MTGDQASRRVPPGIDVTVPSVARMYDYYLGGKDHYAADREAAAQVLDAVPDAREVAQANRSFLRRAVRYLAAECGIRQFLDLGTGLPTQGNVHEIAQAVDPTARVVYVDNDPVVLAHARALLATNDTTTVIQADLRDPAAVLKHPDTLALVDFDAPVAVLAVAVLHFVEDSDDPAGLVAAYREAVAPGSYVVLSHAEKRPATTEAAKAYERASSRAALRTREEIAALFDGWELVVPGLVPVSAWRPDEGRAGAADAWILAGVGRKR